MNKRYLPHLVVIGLVGMIGGILVVRSRNQPDPLATSPSRSEKRTTPTQQPPASPVDFEPERHRYQVFTQPVTWADAKKRCEQMGGKLATLPSEEMHRLVKAQLPKASAADLYFWIGLTDEAEDGSWKWITGDPPAFTAWQGDEPKDDDESDPDYAVIMSSTKSARHAMWAAFSGPYLVHDELSGFICEWTDDDASTSPVPPDAMLFDSRHYKVFNNKVSWYWADKECRERGGHLASITTPKEQEFVATLLTPRPNEDDYYWIGLTDVDTEGTWKWTTGDLAAYVAWRSREPNNGGGNEDFAAVAASPTPTLHGTWIDLEGPHKSHGIIRGFICEWESSGTEPMRRRNSRISAYAHGGHHYAVFNERVSWTQAKWRCKSRGGHLLTIDDADEWKFITSNVLDSFPRGTYSWIGLSDQGTEGNWIWEDNARVSFTRWRKGEPNNGGGDEDYGAMFSNPGTAEHGDWIDLNGPYTAHEVVVGYICEWDY